MHEAAQLIGFISAFVLIAAVAAWVKLFRGPVLRRLGGIAAPNLSSVKIASRLLVVAASLSAVAALILVAGLFAT